MILVDTTPLVGLCDADDACHSKALADFDRLAKESFALCEPVLTETCFMLGRPERRTRLAGLIEGYSMLPPPIADLVAFRAEVFRWLDRYAEHLPDWADACLAVLSQHHPRARVWTYDGEFRTTWRRPNGTKIPIVT